MEKLAVIFPHDIKNIVVVGDIHGDFRSFKEIRKFANKKNILVFLGDYADRGGNGAEVIAGVRGLLEKYPENVIALKGNHEDYTPSGEPKAYPNTLIHEVGKEKWPSFFSDLKENFLDKLCLAAIIPNKILFVHGGIFARIRGEKDLKYADSYIEENVLWSDPCAEKGEHPNPRGAGVLFVHDVSDAVTKRLGVRYIVRSHQPDKAVDGPHIEHDGRVVTINSSSIYGKPFVLKMPANNVPDSGFELKKYARFI